MAGLPDHRRPTASRSGATVDGRRIGKDGAVSTAEPARPFPYPVTVGYMYILKLHHLVDDKIHARSDRPVLDDHPAAARW